MSRNIPAIAQGLIDSSIEFDACVSNHEARGSAEWVAFDAELRRLGATEVTEQRERDGSWVATYHGVAENGQGWQVALIDRADVWNVSQHTVFGVTDDPAR